MKVHKLFTLFKVCSSIDKNVLLSLCLGYKNCISFHLFLFIETCVLYSKARAHIFSREQPFYERAMRDLDP
jgi:hypothetical protein